MKDEDRARISDLLDSFGTLTLATHGPAGPWAATVFFARDEALNLYFVSGPETRHVRDLLATGAVAVTVNGVHDSWDDIRGLQISGIAEPVPDAQRPEVVERYLGKFTKIRRAVEHPANAAERLVADRFRASPFFRVRPVAIRLIDNTVSFGHRTEWGPDSLA